MPLPKPESKQIPKEAIWMREIMTPPDYFIVVAKTENGVPVTLLTTELFKWPDGIERHWRPFTEGTVPDDVLDRLKDGMAERYSPEWCNDNPVNLAMKRGPGKLRPVKRSDNMFYAPFAAGDDTDDFIRHVDVQLHYRDRELQEKMTAVSRYLSDPNRYMEERAEEVQDKAENALRDLSRKGVRVPKRTPRIEQEFKALENDAVTFKPDAGIGEGEETE